MRKTLVILALCGLAACKRQEAPTPTTAATPAPTPEATPEEGFAGVATQEPIEPAGPVEAPDTVNFDVQNTENQLVKNEVLARIDVMPNLKDEEKDKLYVQVERARGMGKLMTIPFASGKSTLGATEIAALGEKLKLPQIQKFADDPTVVFVVLGFADKKGDPKKNLAISRQRADSAVDALKEKAGVMNVTHAVGMGGSEIFDAQSFDKNRVVEIWAVLP